MIDLYQPEVGEGQISIRYFKNATIPHSELVGVSAIVVETPEEALI